MIDEAKFRARYTDEFVRELSSRDTRVLRAIKRNEAWTGASLFVRRPVGKEHVIVEREKDYETVLFGESWSEARVFDACDQAVRALGARLEDCLNGRNRSRKSLFSPVTPGGGVRSVASWEEDEHIALWSMGACPHWLKTDGITFLRRYKEGPVVLTGEAAAARPELLDEAKAKYGDALFAGDSDAWQVDLSTDPEFQVRFGYYGNTAPDARVTGWV